MCTKTLLLFGGVGGGMAIYTYAGQKVDQFYFNPKKSFEMNDAIHYRGMGN